MMVCKYARTGGLERGFGGTLDIGEDGVGEGEVHRLRLCGDTRGQSGEMRIRTLSARMREYGL